MTKTEDRKVRSEAIYVHFEQLVCDHKLNNRPLDYNRARDYAVNILLERQIQPMLVDKIRSGGFAKFFSKGRFSIRIGFHRYEAFRILHDEGIPAAEFREFPLDVVLKRRGVSLVEDRLYYRGEIKVDVTYLTAAEVRRQRLSENLLRHGLDPVSEGEAFQELINLDGYTVKALSKLYGVAEVTIEDRIRLLKLPTDVQENLRAGKISLSQVWNEWNLETGQKKAKRQVSGFRVRGKREINKALKALEEGAEHPLLVGLTDEQQKLVERTLRWARGEEI